MSITLLIAFLYGGMVWGVFPQFFPREHISWESHLMGLVAGAVLAVYYRKEGPQRIRYEWEDENEEDEEDEEPDDHPPDDTGQSNDGPGTTEITYHYKKDR